MYLTRWLIYGVLLAAANIAGEPIRREEIDPLVQKCLNLPNADSKVYDFIIVGAGASGAPIAGRLSERDDFDILILEAGGDSEGNSNIEIPLLFSNTFRDPAVDWNYFSIPQKSSCQARIDNRCHFSGGKVLGGSSSINGMVFIRGGKADYDRWASSGAIGWSYEEVLPYFVKMENNRNSTLAATRYHGTEGPVIISDSIRTSLGEVFIDSVAESGYPIEDVNGDGEFAFSLIQQNADGLRQDTNRAYLMPAKDRPNLSVKINALVTKVIFDEKTAVGVTYLKNGEEKIVCARKEVIISAGVFKTPQLLMLSGVGPEEHLSEHKIEVINRLPVGQGLEDHPTLLLPFTIEEPISATPNKIADPAVLAEYDMFKTGLLSSNLNEVTGFFGKDPIFGQRQFQVALRSSFLLTSGLLSPTLYNIHEQTKSDFRRSVGKFTSDQEGFTLAVLLLHSRIHGWVKLNSTDPLDDPLINPRYLEHPDDLRDYAKGVADTIIYIENSSAMNEIGTKYIDQELTACQEFVPKSDGYWRCMIQQLSKTGNHPSCTCRMGDPSDPTSVVDPQLRIHNMQRIRVADASVMPSVVSGNTNAPSIMIGERAADILKEAYPRET